jgi:hypothetical protein
MHILNDVFGRLTWDEQSSCWVGEIDWPPGLRTEVLLCHPGPDIAAGLRGARASLDWLKTSEEDARRCVAGQLLHVYNTAWRDEELPVSTEDFIARLELVRIVFGAEEELLLTYDGGEEMFNGQYIDAEFSRDGSFRGARLVD